MTEKKTYYVDALPAGMNDMAYAYRRSGPFGSRDRAEQAAIALLASGATRVILDEATEGER